MRRHVDLACKPRASPLSSSSISAIWTTCFKHGSTRNPLTIHLGAQTQQKNSTQWLKNNKNQKRNNHKPKKRVQFWFFIQSTNFLTRFHYEIGRAECRLYCANQGGQLLECIWNGGSWSIRRTCKAISWC